MNSARSAAYGAGMWYMHDIGFVALVRERTSGPPQAATREKTPA